MVCLDDLDRITTTSKTDVINSTVCARSMQPDSVHKTTDFLTHLGEAPLQVRGGRFVDANGRWSFTARKLVLDRV